MASGVIKALESERDDLAKQITDLQAEHKGKAFPEKEKLRWNELNKRHAEFEEKIELHLRDERMSELEESSKRSENVERVEEKSVQFPRPFGVENAEIFDVRSVVHDIYDPAATGNEYKQRALRAVDQAEFYSARISKEDAQSHVDHLIRDRDSEDGKLSRHLLVTGSDEYKRAWGHYITGEYLNSKERDALERSRALSLTGTSGGFAVPFELDPSIIPTSNLAINPYRSISRVIPVTVDEWRGVSSAGVTAAYAAEATAATDASPTLAQPTISTEKARAFIPFSIEIGMDWPSMQAEMGGLISDAKDELEATKFTLGSGTNEPFGVVTGATTVFTAAATNAIVIADIYGWQKALGARFRPRSTFVMNLGIANRIRQFDTAGGAGIWIDTLKSGLGTDQVPSPGAMESNLLGKPVYESTAISEAMTTGQLIGVYGDFNYYVIIERVGIAIEVIPHLFDVTNNMPTGQRGLYAYWRNGAKVVDANAFRTLKLA